MFQVDALCLCRVCLSTNSIEYIELDAPFSNDKTFLECFNELTQLTAKSVGVFPNMLCSECAQALRNAYKFIMDAREADVVLQNRLNENRKNCNFVQILSPKSDSFIDTDIENMEVVVIKSLEEEIVEDAVPNKKLNYEWGYCSENDRNIVKIQNKTEWKCSHCKRAFNQCDHTNCQRDILSFKCLQCSKHFRTQKSLERHRDIRHKSIKVSQEIQEQSEDDTSTSCAQCSIDFGSTDGLEQHQKLEHNRTACSPCRKDSNKLNEHLRIEHSMEQKLKDEYAENLIELDSSDVEGLECIILEDIDKLSMLKKCSICKKKLLARNMEKHLKLHTRQEDFLCSFCPRHFKNQKSVRQHEKTHFEESEDTVYACSACDRQYGTESLLEQHRKNTHKEREHICSICGNAFKLRNQLTNHMKLHLEKNIKCPHCDKKYARQFDLNVHLRTHTGEMPYKCHLCDKRFAIKVRLTYHLQKHYGVKHTCKECDAQFNSKQKLKTHSFKHTGMPYRCELCDDHGFPNRDVFKRHLIRVHNATISEEALLEMFQRYTGKTPRIREISISMEDEIEISPEETIEITNSAQPLDLNID